MIRIRRIFNPFLESNSKKMEQVKEIIAIQFPLIALDKIEEIDDQMVNPIKYQYQSSLFIAEDIHETVKGFALLLYLSDLKICYLDYLAVTPNRSSSGVGGALYERMREETLSLDAYGLFFECLPDDPTLCRNEVDLIQNQKRLAFYERFGARPIANTQYEAKVNPSDDCPPYLVFDGLGERETIPNPMTRKIMSAILQRKYGDYCDASYIQMVVESVRDEPVVMRPFRYIRNVHKLQLHPSIHEREKIMLVVNDKHSIHHIRERGYIESPVRVKSILNELDKSGLFIQGKVTEYPDQFILDVHDKSYFNYFKQVCKNLPKGKSVYPYVFPIRNAARAPKILSVRAGYFCIDTFTPLNQDAYLAARWGVNCTLTATDEIIAGRRSAYVLTRPPGHHSERSVFGGFCYFNNCAIAANHFSKIGKVAILDVDYHHGNGQQQIFYNRNDILTLSIHGHPSFAYPYFSGFAEEKGEDSGKGFNINFPLPEKITHDYYVKILKKALRKIQHFKPDYLIIALGLDPAKGDPTGTWDFSQDNFRMNGELIGGLQIQTLIVQEGGYKTQSLGANARSFFTGFFQSHHQVPRKKNE